MNLLQETANFRAWFFSVMQAFVAVRPWTTLTIVVSSGMARFTHLLAFFLPLKIVLLAGSPGIPSYFPFIDPDHKLQWIIALAAASLLLYVATLVFNGLAQRLSEDASAEIVQGANELVVLDNQEFVGRSTYGTFCEICANLLFITVSTAILAVLTPWLLAGLSGVVVAQYLISAWAVSGDDTNPGPFMRYVEERLSRYLQVLSSTAFFVGFMVLLVPFLIGGGPNILVVILAIIVLRQMLTAMVSVVINAVRLAKDRHRLDALIFREAQLAQPEPRPRRALRAMFDKTTRQRRSARALADAGVEGNVDVCWQDSKGPVKTLLLVVDGGPTGQIRYFQQQIFSQRHLRLLENEGFLFRHIARSQLHAPEVLARFSEGVFECQICHYGLGRSVPAREWRGQKLKLLAKMWSCEPPAALIAGYTASQPLLHQRLEGAFIERMRVAVDTEEEAETLETLQTILPTVRARLQTLPLYCHNPDLTVANAVVAEDDNVLVMHWGRWSLEPLGAGYKEPAEQQKLIALLPSLRSLRGDIPPALTEDDIRLAALCHQLEFQIKQELYKAALSTAGRILENPTVRYCEHRLMVDAQPSYG